MSLVLTLSPLLFNGRISLSSSIYWLKVELSWYKFITKGNVWKESGSKKKENKRKTQILWLERLHFSISAVKTKRQRSRTTCGSINMMSMIQVRYDQQCRLPVQPGWYQHAHGFSTLKNIILWLICTFYLTSICKQPAGSFFANSRRVKNMIN